jgi:hypothetical protein
MSLIPEELYKGSLMSPLLAVKKSDYKTYRIKRAQSSLLRVRNKRT